MEQYPPLALTQFRWIRYRLPSVNCRLYIEPFGAVDVAPKVQAHLSAFSYPRVSYHAFRSESVTASSNSCAMIEAIPSAPAFPFGLVVCIAQADGHRSGFPMNAYLMSF